MRRAFLVGLTPLAGLATAQPTITNLGTLPGTAQSYGRGISPDAASAAGNAGRAWRWRAAEGLVDIGSQIGAAVCPFAGMSADGESILVNAGGAGVIWSPAHPAGDIIPRLPDVFLAVASGLSDDGAVAVGWGDFNAGGSAPWLMNRGLVVSLGLPQIPGINGADVAGLSGDGSVVVGNLSVPPSALAFRWCDNVFTTLGVAPDASSANVRGVSRDGAVVFGECYYPGRGPRAFRWTAASGMEDLGVAPQGSDSVAYAANEDGSTIVGTSGTHPFLWTRDTGMLRLDWYAAGRGLNLAGWNLYEARAVSADGSAVVGSGWINEASRAFLIRGLPPTFIPCPADVNHDRFVDFFDYADFVAAFESGAPLADFNHDGFADFFDYADFVAAFETGC